jgi:DNA polymerase-4
MFVITPEMGPGFAEALPVAAFHGIGPATAAKMNRLGIASGADLKARSLAFVQEHFGKAGTHFYSISRGIDERPVRPDRVRKSAGAENTFASDLWTLEAAQAELEPRVEKLWTFCERSQVRGRTVTLKVKYQDFEQITRSRSLPSFIESRADLASASTALLAALFPSRKGIRLLGVSLSSLGTEAKAATQLSLLMPS